MQARYGKLLQVQKSLDVATKETSIRFSDVGMAKGGKRQGAGRPRRRAKVEDCPRLDVGLLRCERWQTFAGGVLLARSPCALGGHRTWLLCPRCEGRAGVLYLRGHALACRSCHGLVYRSQSQGKLPAALRRMHKRMAQLGPDFTRPKGMHWHTYWRLLQQAHVAMVPVCQMVLQHQRHLEGQVQALLEGLNG